MIQPHVRHHRGPWHLLIKQPQQGQLPLPAFTQAHTQIAPVTFSHSALHIFSLSQSLSQSHSQTQPFSPPASLLERLQTRAMLNQTGFALSHSEKTRSAFWQALMAEPPAGQAQPAWQTEILSAKQWAKHGPRFQQVHFPSANARPSTSAASSEQLPSKTIQPWLNALQQTDDIGLSALALEVGGEAIAQLVSHTLEHKQVSPQRLRQVLKAAKQNPAKHTATKTQLHGPQVQFQGFDPFGATFAVGLTCFVYGKIKQNPHAIKVGKVLMLIGVLPNLALMGTAIAAYIKVALFGAPG